VWLAGWLVADGLAGYRVSVVVWLAGGWLARLFWRWHRRFGLAVALP